MVLKWSQSKRPYPIQGRCDRRPRRRLNISDLLGHIPLPAKITIEVQGPIEVDADDQAVHEKVIASLQAGVDRLAAERRFPVIG